MEQFASSSREIEHEDKVSEDQNRSEQQPSNEIHGDFPDTFTISVPALGDNCFMEVHKETEDLEAGNEAEYHLSAYNYIVYPATGNSHKNWFNNATMFGSHEEALAFAQSVPELRDLAQQIGGKFDTRYVGGGQDQLFIAKKRQTNTQTTSNSQ